MNVSWHSVDLRSGRRGTALTTEKLGKFGRIVSEPTSTELSVLCWDAARSVRMGGWDEGTQPGRTMVIAVDDDNNEEVLWGGMVTRRASNRGEWVNVYATTLEHYFDRRFVGDLYFDGVDQGTIGAGLIGELAVDGLNFTVDAPMSPKLRDLEFFEDEKKTVLTALSELADLEDGPEFTVELEWEDVDHTLLRRVVRIRDRIGSCLDSPVLFEMPGCVNDFDLIEDFTTEFGANDVVAYSSGEGSARPESSRKVATNLIASGWARFQRAFSPAASIDDEFLLDSYAAADLAEKQLGLMQLGVVADLITAPRINKHWWLGDDLTVALSCPRFPQRIGPDGEIVPGWVGRVRAVGWEIDVDDSTITPDTREVL